MSLANVLGCVAAALYIPPSDPVVNFSYVTNLTQWLPFKDESSLGSLFTHLDPPFWNATGGKFDSVIKGRTDVHSSGTIANPTVLNLSNSDFTIECWIKASAEPPSGTFLSRWGTIGNRCWYLSYDASGNRFRFIASTDGSASTVAINYDFDVESINLATAFDGNPHHLSVTRSGGVIYMHFDGDLATGTSSSYNISTTALYDSGTYPFLVGASTVSNLTPTSGWQEFLDEVRITIGSARYSQADFTPPSTKFGRNSTDDPSFSNVKLLMGFDTPQGWSVVGSAANTPVLVGNGQAYTGITADGFGRRGSVTPPYYAADSGYLLGNGDFTIELFGVVETSSWGTGQILGVRRTGTSGEVSWAITHNSTGSKFQFVYSTDGTNDITVDFTGVTPAFNTYYDLAVSRKGSSLYLYVNGTLVNTYTIGSATIYAASSTPMGIFCGMNSALSSTSLMTCRMKAMRITKGAYRYHLSSYTVPTLPLPTS